MKSFVRAKYGKPETKQELLQRLKKEKLDLETKSKLTNQIENKNKNEFHFGFYSVNKNMVKVKKLKLDEMKRALKYIDSEIKRCENKIESIMPFNKKELIIFDSKIQVSADTEPTTKELTDYIYTLKEKRREIVFKIEKCLTEIEKM